MNNSVTAIGVWVLRAALSLWITTMFFVSPGIEGYKPTDFDDTLYGKAPRPFAMRPLAAWVIRGAIEITPARLRDYVETTGGNWIQTIYGPNKRREMPMANGIYEHLIALLITATWLCAFSWVCEKLWHCFYRPSFPQAKIFSLVAVLGLPVFFKYHSYLYDFPSLCLYALCLYLMARRNWAAYFLVFFLACLSKETSLLLIGVFAIYHIGWFRTNPRAYWLSLAAQALIYVPVRIAIGTLYRYNPGSVAEFHLFDHNIHVLLTRYDIQAAVAWLFVSACVLDGWPAKPWLLRVATGMILPLVVVSLFFGYLDELRVYYEVYVPALLLGAYTFLRLFGHRLEICAPITAHEASHLQEGRT
jgi:hypothetical protein